MVVRASDLQQATSHYLVRQIAKIPNIDVRLDTEVIGLEGDDHLEALTLCNPAGGTMETVKAGYLFVFIGAAPRTDWLDGVVARDARGSVLTGPDLADGRRPAAGPSTGIRAFSRPACPVCSPRATFVPTR